MVDSINGVGGPQNLTPTNRSQNSKVSEEKRAAQSSAATPVSDEVKLSDEALSLSQAEAAEETARQTRSLLEEQLEETLSADRKRVDKFL